MTATIQRTCVICGRVVGDYGGSKNPNYRKHVEGCARRQLVDIARGHAQALHGQVRFEVRATPVEDDNWDGITWTLKHLAARGLAGKRYRVEAWKRKAELPAETYEIELPSDGRSGAVWRERVIVVDGVTIFQEERITR